MDRNFCLPNATAQNTGSFYCHGRDYTQKRPSMLATPTLGYDQPSPKQVGLHWTTADITNGYLNITEDNYLPDTSPGVSLQSEQNESGAFWEKAAPAGSLNHFRTCKCSCTFGIPQCTCGFAGRQSEFKKSIEANFLHWLSEATNNLQSQKDASNFQQSSSPFSSMLGYSFFSGSSKTVDCTQEPGNRKVSFPEKASPIPSNIPLQSDLLPSRDQVESDILSSIFGSNPTGILNTTFDQFSTAECNQSIHVNGRNQNSQRRKRPRLCHFLLELLADPEKYSNIVEWVDRENGVFKFLNSSAVASQWGKRRDKPNMKYENFARSLRTYVAKGIMTKPRSRLVYRFANKDMN